MGNLSKRKIVYILIMSVMVLVLTNCSDSLNSQLKTIVKEINKQCPKQLDEYTRVDSCAVVGEKSIRYYQTVNKDLIVTDTTLFKSNLEPGIISLVKTSPDMRFFKEKEVTVQYRFGDESGKYLFLISVTPDKYKN
ncbi:hypothetical protein [Prevotella sp. 10(H)]|uniref:hypothetical protein n=1 Tax=Prevotella sp. 10(H) TaxID=1158294 RepID=UPI0006923426|nr:hypothetical protein [Prevotella sp. 10(H)]